MTGDRAQEILRRVSHQIAHHAVVRQNPHLIGRKGDAEEKRGIG